MQRPRGATKGAPERIRHARRRWWTGGVLAAGAVVLMACGGGEGAAAADTAPAAPAADGAAAATDAAAAPEPSTPEPAAATPSAPTPSAVKPAPKVTSIDGGPLPAGDLRDAYFHWKDETITVAAYPASHHSKARWRSGMRFAGVPEQSAPELLHCEFEEVPDGRIETTTPVVLRGKFTYRYTAVLDGEPLQIRMDDCEVVSTGGEMPAAGDPWTLGADPIPVAALHDAVMGWQGKTVQVQGWYKSSGYAANRDVTEVNIAGETRGDMAVKCKVAGEIDTGSMADDREGVIVEGTIGEPGFSSLLLDGCRVVNRS